MARLIKTAQALDVDVKELALPLPFVPHRRRRSVELLESVQTGRATNACSSRRTDPDRLSDLSNGEPLSPESKDSCSYFRRCRMRRVRSRAAVSERLVGIGASQPLSCSTVAHTDALRRRAHRPSLFAHSFDQQLSTEGNFAHSCARPSGFLFADLFVWRLSDWRKSPGWTTLFKEQRPDTSHLTR